MREMGGIDEEREVGSASKAHMALALFRALLLEFGPRLPSTKRDPRNFMKCHHGRSIEKFLGLATRLVLG
jgi:hypothetical protein